MNRTILSTLHCFIINKAWLIYSFHQTANTELFKSDLISGELPDQLMLMLLISLVQVYRFPLSLDYPYLIQNKPDSRGYVQYSPGDTNEMYSLEVSIPIYHSLTQQRSY